MQRSADTLEALCCEKCGGELELVCRKKHCKDPLERIRKSHGPVPEAPARGSRTYTAKPKLSEAERTRQKEIGATLRFARKHLGLSMVELGEKVDRKAGSFSVWEAGGARLGPSIIPGLAKVLHLRKSDLTNELHAMRGNGKQ
jgi:ribosome-binding protein aMBF1 (putative translation factor)